MAEGHSSRNYCLDFVKGIACICVVFMHCEFPGLLGTVIQCVSRFCVPFFFMVSGYFSYYKDGRDFPAKLKITHILLIVAASSVFYTLAALLNKLLTGADLSFDLRSAAYLLVFNQPFIIAGQLWFLFALLYVYIMYALIDKLKLQKIAYYSIPVLILIYIALAQGCHLIGKSVPNMVYRNFLIEGFPLFMLGHLIHKREEKLTEKLSSQFLAVMIVLNTAMCLAERYLLGRDFGVNICTFAQVTAIFILALKDRRSGAEKVLTKLGTKYSLFVYVIHPFVWHSLEYVYSKTGIDKNTAALYLMPIMVLFVTIILSFAVEKLIRIYNDRKKEVKA